MSELSPSVRARFDIVSFDPRGVGLERAGRLPHARRARPRDGARDHAADGRRARGRRRGRASLRPAAARQSGALLPYLTTEATARDLDRLRDALGDRQADLRRLLVRHRARRDLREPLPHRVRALALDGAADPVVWTDEATGFLNAQAVGAQHEYKAFLAWCRANRSQCAFAANGDPGAAIDRLLAGSREPGLRADRPAAGGC